MCVCVFVYIYDQFAKVLKTVNSALAKQMQRETKQNKTTQHTLGTHTRTHLATAYKYCAYVGSKFALLSDGSDVAALRSLTRLGACPKQ